MTSFHIKILWLIGIVFLSSCSLWKGGNVRMESTAGSQMWESTPLSQSGSVSSSTPATSTISPGGLPSSR